LKQLFDILQTICVLATKLFAMPVSDNQVTGIVLFFFLQQLAALMS
jgi:hypothetical protein